MSYPVFSIVHKVLQRVFYPRSRAITIYTEDRPESKVLYELLYRRMESSTLKINNIIPLGPKAEVIKQSILAANGSAPSLFVVDGDCDLMMGKRLLTTNLISLDRYCIENYLCCERGIIEYLYVQTALDRTSLAIKLDFTHYLDKNAKLMFDLYVRYAISLSLDVGIRFKIVNDFFNTPGPFRAVDIAKVRAEIKTVENAIKAKLKSTGVRSYSKSLKELIQDIFLKCSTQPNPHLIFASGKDIILPLLEIRIKNIDNASRSMSRELLVRRLAEKIDLEALNPVREKIYSIAS